jgi:hypothetical protein
MRAGLMATAAEGVVGQVRVHRIRMVAVDCALRHRPLTQRAAEYVEDARGNG